MKNIPGEQFCKLDPRLPEFPEPLPNLRRLALDIEETETELIFTETDPETGAMLAHWWKPKARNDAAAT